MRGAAAPCHGRNDQRGRRTHVRVFVRAFVALATPMAAVRGVAAEGGDQAPPLDRAAFSHGSTRGRKCPAGMDGVNVPARGRYKGVIARRRNKHFVDASSP